MNIRIVPLQQGINIAPLKTRRARPAVYDGPEIRELESSDAELFNGDAGLDYIVREFRLSDLTNESELTDLDETHVMVLVFRSGYRLTRPLYASAFGTRHWTTPQHRAHELAAALLRRGEVGLVPLTRPARGHITFLASLIGLPELEAYRRLKANGALH